MGRGKKNVLNPRQLLTLNDLVKGDDAIFATTGVTFLGGDLVETHLIVMRKLCDILKHITI